MPHAHVHEQILLQEGVALCHDAAAEQRVLDDTHHRFIRLRRDDHLVRRHHVLNLSLRLE